MVHPPQFNGNPEGDDQQNGSQQGLREYWTQFVERIWLFLIVFIVIFAGSIVYTMNVTPMYTSIANIEILRDDPDALSPNSQQDLDQQMIRGMEDLNTQINVLESPSMIRQVASRLKDEELTRFMAPFEDVLRLEGPYTPEEVLADYRVVTPVRQSRNVHVAYTHPDPQLAAKIANMFAEEFIERNLRLIVNSSLDAVDALKIRANQQREQVEQLESKLADYREKYGTVSFDERADIDHQELANLNKIYTENERNLDDARSRWELVQQYRDEGRNLWDIPFIGSNVQVNQLLADYSRSRVDVATLSKRYREKHPRMMQAMQRLVQTEQELREAVESAAQKIRAEFQSAQASYLATQQRLKEKEKEILRLGKIRVEYNSIQYELDVAQNLYQGILQRMEVEMAQANMKKPNARIIDNAVPPLHHSRPNVVMNLALGLFGGVGMGLALVFGLAFIDDRVKSSQDVERALNLNLISIVPSVRKMNSFRKARIAETNADPRVAEAFRSLYSTIRISDVGRHSQVILATSTLPSEGKSFVVTNLAYTFASHGERTLLVDADLRMPAVAQSLKKEAAVREHGGGLVGYFEGTTSWENMIVQEIAPNLDLLGSVDKATAPSEIANSTHFIDIINVMRETYDRIIIDSPPLGIVSDALALVPAVDACLYVIKHKGVRKRGIRAAVKRLQEVHMPILGAIMNQVDKSGSGYYHNYYNRAHHKYYGAYAQSGRKQKAAGRR